MIVFLFSALIDLAIVYAIVYLTVSFYVSDIMLSLRMTVLSFYRFLLLVTLTDWLLVGLPKF